MSILEWNWFQWGMVFSIWFAIYYLYAIVKAINNQTEIMVRIADSQASSPAGSNTSLIESLLYDILDAIKKEPE